MSKCKFPFGTWQVKTNMVFDNMFGKVQYYGRDKAYVWGLKRQAGVMVGTAAYGAKTELTNVTVDGYTLKAKYSVLDSDKTRQTGTFRAKLQKDATMEIDYTRDSDYISRWHSETATPSGTDPMSPDPSSAGLRHEVRIVSIGLPIKAGVSATFGNLEVRDLGAGWETHYAIAAAGVGPTAGVSIPVPSKTTWKRIDLHPRVRNWTGAEIQIFTKGGAAVVVSEGTTYLNLIFRDKLGKNTQKEVRGATWINRGGMTLTPKIELDYGTMATGKLVKVVSSKPYLAGAW